MSKPKPTPLTRRDFLKIATGAAVSAVVFPLLVGCEPKPTATSVVPAPDTETPPSPGTFPTAIIDDNFPQPKTIHSVDGVLKTTLLIKMMPAPEKFNPPTPTPTPTPVSDKPVLLRMYGSPKKGTTANPDVVEEWDWSFPGPTFRVNPGDRIELKLLNYLPKLPKDQIGVCEPAYYPTAGPTLAETPAPGTPTLTPTLAFNNDAFPDCFSENDVTNLHYHGMHVKQGEKGDDVLLAIYPHGQDPHEAMHGEEHGMHVLIGENNYSFDVPKDHPQGTFWYHPHKHGATDLQVANGMAGAIIVNDTAPLLKDRQPVDQVLMIQSILPDLAFPTGNAPSVTTVNGVRNPVITLQAGEIQRWRFINATGNAASAFQLNLTGDQAPEMFLIAVDGNYLTEAHWNATTPTRALFLAPGNRADVLVVASKEGSFGVQVKSTTNNQKNKKNESTPTPVSTATKGFSSLLTVNVEGTITPAMKLPEKLPKLPKNLRPFGADEKDACSRTLTFDILPDDSPTQTPAAPGSPTATSTPLVGGGGGTSGAAPKWAINGKQFDPTRVDECMILNTSETWTLINTTAVAHPFHIHLNPFLIQEYVDPTPADPDNPRTTGDNPVGQWQDTIIIPAAKINKKGELKTGKVVIRQRFMDFTGTFVLHCHILGHEDRGMMQLLQVVKDPSECKSGGACVTQ